MSFEIIRMAFESLLANKSRSILSMLGIIIGVSTVIAVFAIGKGAQQVVDDQFQGLSANSLIIMSSRGRGSTGSSNLKATDAQVIKENAEHIAEATSVVRGNATVTYAKESENISILGIDAGYFEIANYDLQKGEAISEEDISGRSKVVVIGVNVVGTLFNDGEDPVGQAITINRKSYEVIGTLNEVGSSFGPSSPDDSIFAPYTTAEASILGNNAFIMLSLTVDDVNNVEAATEEVTAILRDEHRLKSSQEDDFRVMNAGSMVGTAQEAASLMTVLLTAIAAITLLVSGIGIMNVMFVTVAERTKEIGIAKAIGGKQTDILGQFLLESVILSMIGGTIGVTIGNGLIYISNNTGLAELIKLVPSLTGIVIGFGFSVAVGIIFGFYPALKASRLDPVDALRSE